MADNENTTTVDSVQSNARILHFLQTAQYVEAEKLSAWLISTTEDLTFEPNFYLGVALQLQGKVLHALEVFKKALTLKPQDTNVMQAIASCYEQLQRYEDSYQQLLKVLEISPDDAVINANLGAILEKREQHYEALKFYNRALEINPKNYTALINKGSLLSSLGRKFEGLAHCRIAHQTHPESIATLYNLADALLSLYKYEEALAYCDAGLAWQPKHAKLLFKKGLVLSCLKQFDEAALCLAEAQVLDLEVVKNVLSNAENFGFDTQVYLSPQTLYLDAMYQAQLKCFWRDRDDYISEWQEALTNDKAQHQIISNADFGFQVMSLSLNGKMRLQLCQNVSEFIADRTWLEGMPPFSYERALPHKKLRIGYLSSDYRLHPTAILSKQIYGLHDKQKFEIYVYSSYNSPNQKPESTRLAIEKDSDVFRDVANLSNIEIATLIHDDEIDILVDMNGHTSHARTHVMAMRPAPIKVLYLAFLQSMGADFIDYVMLDHTVCPPEKVQDWQENVVRLPDCLYVYDNETSNQLVKTSRSNFGLPDDVFVFCSFNTNYKIEPEIFTVWMRILLAVPDSVLWILSKDEVVVANLQREAMARGVAKERIIFAPPLPHTEHLLRYQLADLFVDTFWYGAHTTALDALWQGLPVLCCIGEVSTSRVAASYLNVLEMPELIAQDFDEYQDKAIYYATNPTALKALKEKLQAKKVSTPLFNTPLTVKHLESAYQLMWQRYEAGLPPDAIDVPNLLLVKIN